MCAAFGDMCCDVNEKFELTLQFRNSVINQNEIIKISASVLKMKWPIVVGLPTIKKENLTLKLSSYFSLKGKTSKEGDTGTSPLEERRRASSDKDNVSQERHNLDSNDECRAPSKENKGLSLGLQKYPSVSRRRQGSSEEECRAPLTKKTKLSSGDHVEEESTSSKEEHKVLPSIESTSQREQRKALAETGLTPGQGVRTGHVRDTADSFSGLCDAFKDVFPWQDLLSGNEYREVEMVNTGHLHEKVPCSHQMFLC